MGCANCQQRGSTTGTGPEPRRFERENERLRREVEQLREELREREKKLEEAGRKIGEAEKQIADLERQLGLRERNSTTSSKPPSSDGLAGSQRKRGSRRKKSCRKPGGQPGHAGSHRVPVPADLVDKVVEILPERCGHCEGALSPDGGGRTGKVSRHQVTELPAIKPLVTEYQCPSVCCPGCGKNTRAPLPPEVAGDFGPELTALVAYLTVVCRLPRRVVWALLEQVLGIKLSLGSVQAGWEEASESVAGPCGELEEQLRKEPVLNSDETGYRTNGEKRWLWALVAPAFVFYKVAASRGAEVLVKLLGEIFAGILCSDRCPTYLKYHKGTLQFCWAHFKRNILGALQIAKTTDAERFCRDALSLHARLFRLWHRFRGGPAAGGAPMTRQQLVLESIPIQKRFFALAQRNLDSGDRDVRNLARALFQHNEKFFAFIEHEGVEPTNNSAERALRCAVQWRKTSFGSRSADGEVAMARLLTATQTCRIQGRNPLDYLKQAVHSHRAGLPAPSLLPAKPRA